MCVADRQYTVEVLGSIIEELVITNRLYKEIQTSAETCGK